MNLLPFCTPVNQDQIEYAKMTDFTLAHLAEGKTNVVRILNKLYTESEQLDTIRTLPSHYTD